MKSIAIIDTPNMCFECPLRNGDECNLIGDIEGEADYVDERCPLKPMPEPFDASKYTFYESEIDYANGYECGFNSCIEEILGEENE